MKIYRKLFVRILFSLAILFCFGVISYTNQNNQKCIVVLFEDTNNLGNTITSDNDTFNDDQITRSEEFNSPVESNDQPPIPTYHYFFPELCHAIWQPPKIS